MPTLPLGNAPLPSTGPATPAPSSGDRPPTSTSLVFLLVWFVLPVVILLIVDALGLVERLSVWLGLG